MTETLDKSTYDKLCEIVPNSVYRKYSKKEGVDIVKYIWWDESKHRHEAYSQEEFVQQVQDYISSDS